MKPFFATLMCTTLLASAGCLSLDGTESDDEGTLTEVALDDSEMQGRTVLSAILDQSGGYRLAVSTSTVDTNGTSVRLRLAGEASLEAVDPGTGAIIHAAGSEGLAGMVLTDFSNSARTLTIVRVVPEPPLTSVAQFELLYRTSDTDPGVNPCKNGLAIPIAGYYDLKARHVAAAGRISFACKEEGVAEKCFRWGYPPGPDSTKEPWRAHQLCTRMAMGDVCKDGTPHTLDETFIKIWDEYPTLGFDEPTWMGPIYQGVTVWPPPPGVFKFEAAWPEDDDEPVICLSKTRWQGLPVDELDSCETPPLDPRKDAGGLFCEDMLSERPDLLADATIVNASKYTDLLIEQWTNAAGTDSVSTVLGYWPGDWPGPGQRPVQIQVKAPFPGYTHDETQGTLLRSLPGSISQGEIRHVFSFTKPMTGRVLGRIDDSSAWPKNGYTQGTWEGMVFVDPPASGFPPVTPLYLYRDGTDYFNSTLVLGSPIVTVDTVGYVPVVGQ